MEKKLIGPCMRTGDSNGPAGYSSYHSDIFPAQHKIYADRAHSSCRGPSIAAVSGHEPAHKRQGRQFPLTPLEEYSLMGPDSTAMDIYEAKLGALARKHPDIPANRRAEIVRKILEDERINPSGKTAVELVADAAMLQSPARDAAHPCLQTDKFLSELDKIEPVRISPPLYGPEPESSAAIRAKWWVPE